MFDNNLKLTKELKKYPYKLEYVHNVDDLKIDIPMIYRDLTTAMFFFPIKISKAQKYIQHDNIKLVPYFKDMTLLAINIFEYRKSPVPPFNEFTFSLPVMQQNKKSISLFPLIFDQMFKNFGFYVIQLGASNNMARKHIEEIWGYPTFDKNLDISLNEKKGIIDCSIKDGDHLIISVSENLSSKNKEKFYNKKFNTFFRYNNELRKVELNTLLFSRTYFGKNNAKIIIGNHEISNILKDLGVDSKIITIFYPNAIELAGKVNII